MSVSAGASASAAGGEVLLSGGSGAVGGAVHIRSGTGEAGPGGEILIEAGIGSSPQASVVTLNGTMNQSIFFIHFALTFVFHPRNSRGPC